MLCVYTGENADKTEFINSVLLRHIAAPFDILKDENGKPYIKGNPIYFNLSHSGSFCTIAVSSSPVGIDTEVYGKGIRKGITHAFPADEQAEIKDEKDFLTHWTAREAYVKYCGGTLAHMLRQMAFTGGVLSYGGVAVPVQPRFIFTEKYVIAVCGGGEIQIM